MTIPLKVAMQGGGAKLVTLVAAAEVLEELVEQEIIDIRQISGASAGAIAACMLSYNKPVAELRTRMLNAGQAVVDHFGDLPSKPVILYKMLRGTPLLPEEQFRSFVRTVFQEYPEFSQLSIPTRLVVSDLRNREKRLFASNSQGHKLEDIIVSSCALPLVFRTYKNTDFLVDGGLCSNFPTEQVLSGEPGCQILGFSFADSQEAAPNGLLSYLGALASTSIEASVEENAKRLRDEGGIVCELPNDYNTLEFVKALADLSPKKYPAVLSRVRNQIIPIIAELRTQHQRQVDELRKDKQLSAVHRSLKRMYPYVTVRSTMHIVGTSLNQQRNSDRVLHAVYFRSENRDGGEVFGVRVGLLMGDPAALFQDEEGLRIEGPDGNRLAFKSSHVQEDGGHYVIIFLDEPLKLAPGECLKIEMRSYQKHTLEGLRDYGMEWVRSMCRQRIAQETGEIIIEVPEEYQLILEDLCPQAHLLPDDKAPTHRSDMEERWCTGQVMSQQEIGDAALVFPEPGFMRYGWRAENIASSHYYGILLTRR